MFHWSWALGVVRGYIFIGTFIHCSSEASHKTNPAIFSIQPFITTNNTMSSLRGSFKSQITYNSFGRWSTSGFSTQEHDRWSPACSDSAPSRPTGRSNHCDDEPPLKEIFIYIEPTTSSASTSASCSSSSSLISLDVAPRCPARR